MQGLKKIEVLIMGYLKKAEVLIMRYLKKIKMFIMNYPKKFGIFYVRVFTFFVIGFLGIMTFLGLTKNADAAVEYIVAIGLSALVTIICWAISRIKYVKEIVSVLPIVTILVFFMIGFIGAEKTVYYTCILIAFVLIPIGINIRIKGSKEVKKANVLQWYGAVYAAIIFYFFIRIMVTKYFI